MEGQSAAPDLNNDECFACGGLWGSLLCCDTCPLSWHLNCINMRPEDIPGGDWHCPVCTKEQTHDYFEAQRARAQELLRAVESKGSGGAQAVSQHRDSHADLCMSCGTTGFLLCCDSCANAFHLRCLGLQEVPEAEFVCCVCDGSASHADLAASRMASRSKGRHKRRHAELSSSPEYEEEEEEDEEKCGLCQEPLHKLYRNSRKHDRSVLLRPVGPFPGRDGEEVMLHFECAIFSPRIYIDKRTKRFCNVTEELVRARQIRCQLCHKQGASVGCIEDTCTRSYHLHCAREALCHVDAQQYAMTCAVHATQHTLEKHFGLQQAQLELDLGAKVGKLRRPPRLLQHADLQNAGPGEREELKQQYLATRQYRSAVELWDSVSATKPSSSSSFSSFSSSRRRRRKKQRTGDEQAGLPVAEEADAAFSGVRGLGSEISLLQSVYVVPLLYPEVLRKFKVKGCQAVMLHGPPGCGKTLLVKSLLRGMSELVRSNFTQTVEDLMRTGDPSSSCSSSSRGSVDHQGGGSSEVTLFHRKGTDCLSKFHGEAERTLRRLFQQAREASPSLIFFDEMDGLVPVRSAKQNQVYASVVTTLLSLMDEVGEWNSAPGNAPVFVVGATNQLHRIDPSLRRAGRFQHEIYIGLPDLAARQDVLNYYARDFPGIRLPADQPCLDEVAQGAGGFSPAELKHIFTEAVFVAFREQNPRALGAVLNVPLPSGATPPPPPNASRRQPSRSSRGDRGGGSEHRTSPPRVDVQIAHVQEAFRAARGKRPGGSYNPNNPSMGVLPSRASVEGMKEGKAVAEDAQARVDACVQHAASALRGVDGGLVSNRVMFAGVGRMDVHEAFFSGLTHALGLENWTVRDLGLPALVGREMDSDTAEQACVATFQAALVRQNPRQGTLLLLRGLDEWWANASPALRATLSGCLDKLQVLSSCSDGMGCQSVVVVASAKAPWTAATALGLDMLPNVFSFFAKSLVMTL
jgi:hypothetical protein